MVDGQTGNAIGDVLIAKILDPYKRVVRVTGYDILVGVSSPYTVGTLTLTEGSTTVSGFGTNFNVDDGGFIIVGNTLLEVASQVSPQHLILAAPATFSSVKTIFYAEENQYNQFSYKYRWSNDGGEYAEFKTLNTNTTPGDLFNLEFDGTVDLYLDIRAEIDALMLGFSLTVLSVTFTVEDIDGLAIACPQYCINGCDDPFAYSGCANIKVECVDNANIFQPYQLTKNNNLYKQLVEITSDVFGHAVRYYRTEPKIRTKDVIFMEYSLFSVAAVGDLKVNVPDNEFPTEALQYDVFGMGFEDFEIHITDYQFEKIFGLGKRPRVKDYLYFPINNKMYEIKTVALADEFNVQHTYYRVMLTKYQDRSSVEKAPIYETELENLVTGVEEIFGAEIQDEYTQTTNPQQLIASSHAWDDGVRNSTADKLKITDYDLKNRWTIVSKNYYDLSSITVDETAVEYVQKAVQPIDENLAYTTWFSPTFDSADTVKYQLFNGDQFGEGFTARISSTVLEITVNGQIHTFTHGLILGSDEWYGLVINMSNVFREISVWIYHLDEANNAGRPQDASNALELQFTEVKFVDQSFIWDLDRSYRLKGGKLKVTNIRLWEKTIEEEEHSNVLNQSLVRDAQLAKIIDNAIPSLSYQRYYNAR
tara:strand:+ start:1956 stop:3899 length:1944 start_codon:yes stop_codon:yes gene_type:complete